MSKRWNVCCPLGWWSGPQLQRIKGCPLQGEAKQERISIEQFYDT